MLPVPTDRIVAGLRELDPGARALLGLASRHNVDDEQLGVLMGMSREHVTLRRETAIRDLARGPALRGTYARSEVVEALGGLRSEDWDAVDAAPNGPAGDDESTLVAEPEPEPEPAPEPEPEPAPEPAPAAERGAERDPEPATGAEPMPGAEAQPAPASEDDVADVAPEVSQDDPRRSEEGAAWDEAAGAGAAPRRREPARTGSRPGGTNGGSRSSGAAGGASIRSGSDGDDGGGWGGRILLALVLLAVVGALVYGFTQMGEEQQTAAERPPAERDPQPPGPQPPPAAQTQQEEEGQAGAEDEQQKDEEQKGERRDSGAGATTPGPAARLRPLSSTGNGRGTVRLTDARGRRLRVRVTGLPAPEGTYQIWLYNSIGDAVPLGVARRGRFARTLRAPRGTSGYRYVDVSQEPAGDGAGHSGQSVLRARTAGLRRK